LLFIDYAPNAEHILLYIHRKANIHTYVAAKSNDNVVGINIIIIIKLYNFILTVSCDKICYRKEIQSV